MIGRFGTMTVETSDALARLSGGPPHRDCRRSRRSRMGMRRWVGSGAMSALVVFSSSAPVLASTWQSFSSEEGRFTIDQPELPKRATTYQPSLAGTIESHSFIARDGSGRFRVDLSELPHFAVRFVSTETIYERAKRKFLAKSLGIQVAYVDVAIDGHAGKLLTYRAPCEPGRTETHGQACFVLVGNRLYIFSAVVSKGDPGAKAERFLSSVQFD